MSVETEWVMISLDEKMSRRQGIPARLPVPKEKFEGLADEGLKVDVVRAWIKDFLNNSEPGKSGVWRKQNAQMVSSLEGFLDKAPLWEKAQKGFAENDYDKAISSLKRITVMDPEDHAARLNLASALANTRQYEPALKAFKAVRKTFEGDADFHIAVGHVHLAMKDNDGAVNEMVLALEAQPDCQPALDALRDMGILVAVYENPRDAASLTYVRADAVVPYLTSLWDTETRDAAFYLEQLAYHEREKRHEIALEAATRAIAATTGGASEPAELGRIAALRALSRNDEALAAAEEYAAKAPGSAGALVEKSRCLAAAGKREEAAAAVDAALAIDPGDQNALLLRFWPPDTTNIQLVNAAIPALKAFADEHASAPGVWRSLARATLVAGKTDEALEIFGKAAALAPDDDELRAEYWSELGKQRRFDQILADAANVTDIGKRDWKVRWNEAEALLGSGKRLEARGAFSAINFDESLHVDLRKRAKRAVKSIDEGDAAVAAQTEGQTPAT